MKRRALIALLGTSAIVVFALIVASQTVPAKEGPLPVAYNPYPPGILPSDLGSEMERVRREINLIFQQGLGQWRALPPPTLTGQPPNTAEHRLSGGTNTRQADELR